jgi:hypothetical protein
MIDLHPNYLEKNGKKEFAILPYEEFLCLQDALDDFEDLQLLREAKKNEANSPTIPFEKIKQEFTIKL